MKKEFKKHQKLHSLGIAPMAYGIVEVALSLDYYDKHGKKHKVKQRAYGIKSQFVDYPEDIWADYAKGVPYDFKRYKHPRHTAKGYLNFCKHMKGVLKKAKIGVCGNWPFDEPETPKLGDVAFSKKKGRWYLVDTGQ